MGNGGFDHQTPEALKITLPVSYLPIYECGAILFSYLAFPASKAEEERANCHAALCRVALESITQHSPSNQWVPIMVKPGYALLRENAVRQALRTFDRRLKDRLSAALVIKPFLQEAETGKPPQLPPGVDRLSINGMAEYLMYRGGASSGLGDVKNFHARVWKPSLSVIHLAVALNVLFERTLHAGKHALGADLLIQSRETIEFLVKTAESLEQIVTTIAPLNIGKTTLWKFRLA